jgi:exopolyphosphatase/guanosine-5'-triphosphate,3'-diphosphate pyrophosphatase
MPVGVVDVGSNTVRLLVTRGGRPILTLRETLAIGECVERLGRIPAEKLDEAADVVSDFVDAARKVGAREVDVLITSPGRQAANGGDLLDAIEAIARTPARIVGGAEEARLAFVGALSATQVAARRRVAVVDVGGGSAQVAVGSRREGVTWSRSIDLGSRRLTSRLLGADPPGAETIARARAEVERHLDGFDPPEPRTTLAVGGSARALKRIVGGRIGPPELDRILELLAQTPSAELIRRFGINPVRAETLPAGAIILAVLQTRLHAPLKIVRAGLREGAVAELDARRAAA